MNKEIANEMMAIARKIDDMEEKSIALYERAIKTYFPSDWAIAESFEKDTNFWRKELVSYYENLNLKNMPNPYQLDITERLSSKLAWWL